MKLRIQRGPGDRLESLHPAYFALVMATGIVSLALQIHGMHFMAGLLFWLNVAFLPSLVAVTLMRFVRFPQAFIADIGDHSRAVGFFTVIAACGVFGVQLLVQRDMVAAAGSLWLISAILWVVVMYGVLTVLMIKRDKPGLVDGINGGWLVIVVATQSVSILTVLVLAGGAFSNLVQPMMFLAVALWLGGGALYLWLMTLIFYRYTFLRMVPEDLTPPYWINMGAVAISTLAGTTLLQHVELSPAVAEMVPFIKGVSLCFWATGTWWIPMLLILGVWRYLVRELPFTYDPLYWGGVFPVGMYSVCTFRLAQVLGAEFLMPLSYAFMIIAIAAWTATFVGLADSLLYRFTRGVPRQQKPGGNS